MIEALGTNNTPKWRGDAEDLVEDLAVYSERGSTCLISATEQSLLLEHIREITLENMKLKGLLKEGCAYVEAMAHGISIWDLNTAPIHKWIEDAKNL